MTNHWPLPPDLAGHVETIDRVSAISPLDAADRDFLELALAQLVDRITIIVGELDAGWAWVERQPNQHADNVRAFERRWTEKLDAYLQLEDARLKAWAALNAAGGLTVELGYVAGETDRLGAWLAGKSTLELIQLRTRLQNPRLEMDGVERTAVLQLVQIRLSAVADAWIPHAPEIRAREEAKKHMNRPVYQNCLVEAPRAREF